MGFGIDQFGGVDGYFWGLESDIQKLTQIIQNLDVDMISLDVDR